MVFPPLLMTRCDDLTIGPVFLPTGENIRKVKQWRWSHRPEACWNGEISMMLWVTAEESLGLWVRPGLLSSAMALGNPQAKSSHYLLGDHRCKQHRNRPASSLLAGGPSLNLELRFRCVPRILDILPKSNDFQQQPSPRPEEKQWPQGESLHIPLPIQLPGTCRLDENCQTVTPPWII